MSWLISAEVTDLYTKKQSKLSAAKIVFESIPTKQSFQSDVVNICEDGQRQGTPKRTDFDRLLKDNESRNKHKVFLGLFGVRSVCDTLFGRSLVKC